MEDDDHGKIGRRISMYCSICGEERVFIWAAWSDTQYFGYPPTLEYGWKCTACGNQPPAPVTHE